MLNYLLARQWLDCNIIRVYCLVMYANIKAKNGIYTIINNSVIVLLHRSRNASCRVPLGHLNSRLTWKCRMMVQISPSVSFGLPSTMSSARMFTSLIFLYRRKSSAIWTFCSMWKRMRPRSRGWNITRER